MRARPGLARSDWRWRCSPGLALLVVMLREIIGLARLATVESLRQRALAVIESDDRDGGRALIADMLSLTRRIPRLARARARLEGHRADIIDGRDLVRMAERELMSPLDIEARRLVVAASKRVSVVTAISPRAAVDMVFVLINALGLVRKLAVLYGGRPGALGVLRLLRQVVSHLAVTGGVALTDSVVQQVIGHGVAARLSARLGEGMINGLLTARLGLLTIDLVRPLPFHELPRPALNDLAGTLLRPAGSTAEAPEHAENRIIGPKSDCFLRPWGPAAICRPSHTRTWPYRPSGGSRPLGLTLGRSPHVRGGTTGEDHGAARLQHASAFGSWRSLRPSGPPLEPEDG